MNRRRFLKGAGTLPVSWTISHGLVWAPSRTLLRAAEESTEPTNPNWTDESFKPEVEVSSYFPVPPWGYRPTNIFSKNMSSGWQANGQRAGAWLKISFPEAHPVREIWILGRPLPSDVVGKDIYMEIHSRAKFFAPPRRIRISLSDGTATTAELRDCDFFQIITLPEQRMSRYVLISVEEVWGGPETQETGIAKVKVFPSSHQAGFEIKVHPMYDARNGEPVQAATLNLINPGDQIIGAGLTVSQNGVRLLKIPLDSVLGRAATDQRIWIPAPLSDVMMDFNLEAGGSLLGLPRALKIPAYHCYFDGGVFALHCTCHNDLGWLDTPEKTADARSSEIILPALKLLKEYPEFRYSMESTVYLMEFLDRHPEKRAEMYEMMKDRRFLWGASYVQCLEAHVGPENLVRQFYYGRRWLRKNFPGVDTVTYYKTDPPSLTLQMPQILAKAGVKFLIQGRIPFGLWRWEAPDGSSVLTYPIAATHLFDPKGGDDGWLPFAAGREPYYASHELPPELMFDYSYDYLPPQPDLPPYVLEQNESMKRFAESWNKHWTSRPDRQIHPPRMVFTTPEAFLEKFIQDAPNVPTLKGDYPINWAYYDEPGHREALLAGRLAHNQLLTAERINVGLGLDAGFQDYPQPGFTRAWMANCWPDHGWGGGKDAEGDEVLIASYEKSKSLADELINQAGSMLVKENSEDPREPHGGGGVQSADVGKDRLSRIPVRYSVRLGRLRPS